MLLRLANIAITFFMYYLCLRYISVYNFYSCFLTSIYCVLSIILYPHFPRHPLQLHDQIKHLFVGQCPGQVCTDFRRHLIWVGLYAYTPQIQTVGIESKIHFFLSALSKAS